MRGAFAAKNRAGQAIHIGLLGASFLAALCLGQSAVAALEAEKELLASGEYQKAASQLEAVLAKTPNQPKAMAALLEALIATGEYRKAAERGAQFVGRRSDASVAAGAAEAWTRAGEYDRAERLVAPFSTARALWLRGMLRKRGGDLGTARGLFQQAAARAASVNLPLEEQRAVARALAELGQFREANQQFSKAIRDDALRKMLWQISVLMLTINSSKIL